jgi:hypothetical protein
MVYYCSWFEVFRKKTLDFASDKDTPNDFIISYVFGLPQLASINSLSGILRSQLKGSNFKQLGLSMSFFIQAQIIGERYG